MAPTRDDLLSVWNGKYTQEVVGWGPRQRLAWGYFSPDDHYEALVDKLIRPGDSWCDVGCGRDIFPSNKPLARGLRNRAFVFGIDPDPNIRENDYISDGFKGVVEDCDTLHRFDIITLRMVAEHVTNPQAAVRKLAELLKPGGVVVVYTPNKWSPVPILTRLVPNRLHWYFKRLVWDAQARDTFPTAFKLNTKADMTRHFEAHGLHLEHFAYLDDCRTFDRYRWLNLAELALQRCLRSIGVRYPENCLLGVFRK